MQLLIHPQNTFCCGLGYGQDAGVGALDQRLEEGSGIDAAAEYARSSMVVGLRGATGITGLGIGSP
jgi:hypothetical protein